MMILERDYHKKDYIFEFMPKSTYQEFGNWVFLQSKQNKDLESVIFSQEKVEQKEKEIKTFKQRAKLIMSSILLVDSIIMIKRRQIPLI